MWRVIAVLLSIAYPFAIYFSIGRLAIWQMALFMAAVALLRCLAKPDKFWISVSVFVTLLAVSAALFESMLVLKMYPVVVNLFLLFLFSTSLRFPPTIIERLARITEPDLPLHAVAYTRSVTKVWIVFFVFNLSAAAYTAIYLSHAQWAIYNGFIAYLLIGLIFAIEYIVRLRVKAKQL